MPKFDIKKFQKDKEIEFIDLKVSDLNGRLHHLTLPYSDEILANLIEGGFQGDIVPVNPSSDEILGLTCYPDQEAEIVVGRQISYIRDFELKRTDGGFVADPIVDTVRDGFALQVTPALSVAAGAIDIDLDLTLSEVAQPILTRSLLRKRGQKIPFEIQIPQLTEFRIIRSGTVFPFTSSESITITSCPAASPSRNSASPVTTTSARRGSSTPPWPTACAKPVTIPTGPRTPP